MWNPVRKINSEWTKEVHEEKLNNAKSKLYSINHSTMPYNKWEQQRAYYKDIIKTEKPAVKYWKAQTRKEVKALDNLNKSRPAKKLVGGNVLKAASRMKTKLSKKSK